MQSATRPASSSIAILLPLTLGAAFTSTAFAALPDTMYKSGFETCSTPALYCADVDQDNYGDIGYCLTTCEAPYDFFSLPPTDCNNNSPQINPGAVEVCDGIDNNCNSSIDEGNPGGGMACSASGAGQCAVGTTYCSSGALMCQSGEPSAELCDDVDNDCDGQVDENYPEKGSPCSAGIGVCEGYGTLACNVAGNGTECSIVYPGQTPTTELCDGLDNDCDGQTDEDFPDKGNLCSAGLGICKGYGTLTCSATGTGTECTILIPGQTPTAETCNGLDDNCDGNVDEGNPGGGGACDTGLPGECAAGTITCDNATLVCKANLQGC